MGGICKPADFFNKRSLFYSLRKHITIYTLKVWFRFTLWWGVFFGSFWMLWCLRLLITELIPGPYEIVGTSAWPHFGGTVVVYKLYTLNVTRTERELFTFTLCLMEWIYEPTIHIMSHSSISMHFFLSIYILFLNYFN